MTTLVRRRRYFAIRCAYVALLLLLLFSTYESSFAGGMGRRSIRHFAEFSNEFFYAFGLAQLTAALFLTPAYVATAIAQEKQRKTIDYLFASDLGNHEIVLGKLLARTANLVILVFAGLPILSFAQLFGGVDAGKIVFLTVLTLDCLIASASLAILLSIVERDVPSALASAYGWLVLLIMGPLGVWVLMRAAIPSWAPWVSESPALRALHDLLSDVGTALLLLNPYWVFESVVGRASTFTGLPAGLIWITVGSLVFSVVCVGLAIGGLRRVHRRQVSNAARPRRSILGRRKQRPNLAVSDRPMHWKEWRLGGGFSKKNVGRWIVALCVAGFYVPFAGVLWQRLDELILGAPPSRFRAEDISDFLRISGTLLIALTYFLVALRAASSVSIERDRNCWDSLLSAPLSAQEIIRAKLIASTKPVFGLVLAFLPAWGMAVSWNALSPYALLTLPTCILVYGFAVAALGIYHSVHRKTTGAALGATLGMSVLLGGLGQGCVMGILVVLIEFQAVDQQTAGAFLAALFPWGVLVGAAFRAEDWNDFYAADFAAYCLVFLVVTFGIAIRLYQHSVGRLGLFSGRIESVIARPPMPVVKKVAPSAEPQSPELAQLASSSG